MGTSAREVITLQFGHYSNFVGTHWWNIQESSFIYNPDVDSVTKEINNDVLFREGKNLMGDVTYTPRLICVDLKGNLCLYLSDHIGLITVNKGSLNTLKQDGVLYDVPHLDDDLRWSGDVTLHKTDTQRKNDFLQDLEEEEETYRHDKRVEEKLEEDCVEEDKENEKRDSSVSEVFGSKFYDLDDTVNVWSDYLRLHLHPKTVKIINQYEHSSESQSFDVFGAGRQLMQERLLFDDMEDRLHFFSEECDHLQGFHVLVDTYDGFGGFASGVMSDLEDEFGSKGIFTIGLSPTKFTGSSNMSKVDMVHRIINSALCYDSFHQSSSAILPVSLADSLWKAPAQVFSSPYLNYKPDLHYHTSAVLAASLDSVSFPYRLAHCPSLMTHMTDALTQGRMKMLSLQSSFPLPFHTSSTMVDFLMSLEGRLPWKPLTPYTNAGVAPYAQSVVLRGIPASRLKGTVGPETPRLLADCSSLDEALKLYLTDCMPTTLSAGCIVQQPCKVTTPYPHIFHSRVAINGEVSQNERPHQQGVDSVPVLTSLQCSNSVGGLLTSLHKEASRVDIKKHHKFLDSGLEVDDYGEVINNLQTMADVYTDRGDDMP